MIDLAKRKKEKFKVESVVNPEDKVKLSLLNMERRFVDIEFAVSELVSKMKSVDTEDVKSVNQRVEELEDLVLVEQVGLTELKNIMQKVDSELQGSVNKEDVSIIKERVKRIENLARAAAQMVDISAELPEEAQLRLNALEKAVAELKTTPVPQAINPMEIADIKRNMNVLNDKVTKLKISIGDLEIGMRDKIKKAVKSSEIKTVDFDYVGSKIESLNSTIDMLSEKRMETELKVASLEQRIEEAEKQAEQSVPAALFEVVKESRKGLQIMKVRTQAIERVVAELSKNMRDVEASSKRFEGFERLTALQKDVDDKLRQFRFVKDETTRLSNRVEMIYDDLDTRLNKAKGIEREVKSITEGLTEMRKEMEKVKFDLKKTGMASNEIKSLSKRIESIDSVVKNMALASDKKEVPIPINPKVAKAIKQLGDRVIKVENTLKDVSASVETMPSTEDETTDFNSKLTDIVDKLVFLESRLTAVESTFQTSSKTQALVIE